jgi:peptide/nickel transport system permease protein
MKGHPPAEREAETPDGEAQSRHDSSPVRRAARRFLHNPLAVVALGYLVLILLVAVLGDWIEPYDPNSQEFPPFMGPSRANWLGTDDLGRDIASRLIDGAHVSVRAGYQTTAMALAIAIPLGLIAGYKGGWVDNVFMRVMDAMMSFPALVLALVIAATLGPGLRNAIIAITIVLIPGFVRLIRASTLTVTQEPFVEVSRSIGTRTGVILWRRILPNVLSPLIVATSLVLGIALIAEASLSFLGLGAQPPQASWGSMLRRGFTYVYSNPYQMVPPGTAIALAVLSFNVVGDALRDALGLAETAAPSRARRRALGLTSVRHGEDRPSRREHPSAAPVHVLDARSTTPRENEPLLSVRGLTVEFDTPTGPVTVVDGVSFDVNHGEVLGLVGESGSGKTVTSMAIMRLLSSPPACIRTGEVIFAGRDLLTLRFKDLVGLRGGSISMVFQDPMASLNPAFTVGNQLIEAVRIHQSCSRRVAYARSVELLNLVGIADPKSRMDEYPHRLSGGMRQRVLIAMALVNSPKLLIADEPTTALDVTVQAQILDLLRSCQRDLGMAMVFVSHDLGVIADIADRAVVMYAGQIVEQAPVRDLFARPLHPYTARLLTATPQTAPIGNPLPYIAGMVPPPGQWPQGCRFASRCDVAVPECTMAPIQITEPRVHHSARCVLASASAEALQT